MAKAPPEGHGPISRMKDSFSGSGSRRSSSAGFGSTPDLKPGERFKIERVVEPVASKSAADDIKPGMQANAEPEVRGQSASQDGADDSGILPRKLDFGDAPVDNAQDQLEPRYQDLLQRAEKLVADAEQVFGVKAQPLASERGEADPDPLKAQDDMIAGHLSQYDRIRRDSGASERVTAFSACVDELRKAAVHAPLNLDYNPSKIAGLVIESVRHLEAALAKLNLDSELLPQLEAQHESLRRILTELDVHAVPVYALSDADLQELQGAMNKLGLDSKIAVDMELVRRVKSRSLEVLNNSKSTAGELADAIVSLANAGANSRNLPVSVQELIRTGRMRLRSLTRPQLDSLMQACLKLEVRDLPSRFAREHERRSGLALKGLALKNLAKEVRFLIPQLGAPGEPVLRAKSTEELTELHSKFVKSQSKDGQKLVEAERNLREFEKWSSALVPGVVSADELLSELSEGAARLKILEKALLSIGLKEDDFKKITATAFASIEACIQANETTLASLGGDSLDEATSYLASLQFSQAGQENALDEPEGAREYGQRFGRKGIGASPTLLAGRATIDWGFGTSGGVFPKKPDDRAVSDGGYGAAMRSITP